MIVNSFFRVLTLVLSYLKLGGRFGISMKLALNCCLVKFDITPQVSWRAQNILAWQNIAPVTRPQISYFTWPKISYQLQIAIIFEGTPEKTQTRASEHLLPSKLSTRAVKPAKVSFCFLCRFFHQCPHTTSSKQELSSLTKPLLQVCLVSLGRARPITVTPNLSDRNMEKLKKLTDRVRRVTRFRLPYGRDDQVMVSVGQVPLSSYCVAKVVPRIFVRTSVVNFLFELFVIRLYATTSIISFSAARTRSDICLLKSLSKLWPANTSRKCGHYYESYM